MFSTVKGCPARLMVDTGTERTIVREDMVDERIVPESTELLCDVTCECISMRRPVSVNMGVGDVMERLPVSRADL